MPHVWHPALFVFAFYMIVLSTMVLIVARWGSPWPSSSPS
jgi:hypothetical protein